MSTTHIPVSSNQSATISGLMARPQWLDQQFYPLQSRFVEIDATAFIIRLSLFPQECDPVGVATAIRTWRDEAIEP